MKPAALRILAAVIAITAATGGAYAHASLLKSQPAEGAVLVAAPAEFVLTFDEPVSPISVRLVEADGTGRDLPGVLARDTSVTIPAPALNDGTHALSWRVISADGHPVGGSVVFSIGTVSARDIAIDTATPPRLAGAIWLVRLLLYLGLFIGVGGRFFAAWVADRPLPHNATRSIDASIAIGLLAAVASLGLQGLDVLDTGFGQLTTGPVWSAVLATTYAVTLAIAVAALVLAGASTRITGIAARRATTVIALIAIGLALSASGHAADASVPALARLAIFMHAISIAFWIGSLVPLAALMRSDDGNKSLARFSRIVPMPIALLVASGAYLAIIQIGEVSALWSTAYGRIFLGKLAAVLGLLLMALWNRVRLTPRAEKGESRARVSMVRSIAVELVLVAIVLGLVATWRFTPPPRTLALLAAQATPLHFHIHGVKAMADVSLAPGRVGPVAVSLAIQNGDFGSLDARAVTLTLSNSATGIQPIRRPARHLDGVLWRIDDLVLPAPGTWVAKVDILITDFDQITLEQSFDVPR